MHRLSRIPNHHRQIDAFGKKPQGHFDLIRLAFEIVKRRAFARGESFVATLTFEILNVVIHTTFAIANERMDGRVADTKVGTGRIQASQSVCVDLFPGTAPTLAA